MIIIDSSCLISLAKINKLELLSQLGQVLRVPGEVYNETVVLGNRKEVIDALKIEKIFNEGKIKQIGVKPEYLSRIQQDIGRKLGYGDYEVLGLAEQENVKEILTDDISLSNIALVMGIQPISSLDVLLESLGKGVIDLDDFKTSVRLLVVERRVESDIAQAYILEGEKIVSDKK